MIQQFNILIYKKNWANYSFYAIRIINLSKVIDKIYMSGFELNKIAGSILLASLIAMISGTVVNILYKPNLLPEERGYKVQVHNAHNADSPSTDTTSIPDIPALMKSANIANGESLVKKCTSCHSLEKNGPNRVGPHLWNVITRDKASVPDYKYSAALTAKGGAWDYKSLFMMIHKPSRFVPGTKMSFAGLSNPQDAADVIEYLRVKAHDAPPPALP